MLLKITPTSHNELSNSVQMLCSLVSVIHRMSWELLSCFCPLQRAAPTGLSGDPLGRCLGRHRGAEGPRPGCCFCLHACSSPVPHLTSLENSWFPGKVLFSSRFSEFGEVTHTSPGSSVSSLLLNKKVALLQKKGVSRGEACGQQRQRDSSTLQSDLADQWLGSHAWLTFPPGLTLTMFSWVKYP